MLFGMLAKLFPRRRNVTPPVPTHPQRILVLAPVLRGDYIILSPLIASLRGMFPSSIIGVVVTEPSSELARVDPNVDEVLFYWKLPRWFQSMRRIARFKPDVVVNPKGHPAFTETLLLAATRAPVRIGLDYPGHTIFLTHPVPHQNDREHRVTATLRLLAPFGAEPGNVSKRLHIGRSSDAEERAERVFRRLGAGEPWISVNLSAGSSTRLWRFEKWGELISQAHRLIPGARFMVLGSVRERRLCAELARRFEYAFTVPTGGFLEAAALAARTRLLVSPDTGIVHAAAARGVPVVVLYNGDRINYVRFGPSSITHRAVFAPAGEDVSAIETRQVLNAVTELLAELGMKPTGDCPQSRPINGGGL